MKTVIEIVEALERGCLVIERGGAERIFLNGKMLFRISSDRRWIEVSGAETLEEIRNEQFECVAIIEPDMAKMRDYLLAEQHTYKGREIHPSYYLDAIFRTTTECGLEIIRKALYELEQISEI